MKQHTPPRSPGVTARRRVMHSAGFLALQVALTSYPDGASSRVFWFVVGAALLWLVLERRSRVARGVVVVTSLVGAILYGLGAVEDVSAALVAVAFLGQAVPLLTGEVRDHVRSTRSLDAVAPEQAVAGRP